MEAASRALVQRRYFDCERLCTEALERAFIAADYERMSRILLPLEEARRQKRDLAFDTGDVQVVDGVVPTGRNLRPGCYLVSPPRVGIDGRLLREAANKKKIPTIIVVREPESRDGMWPVVSIGPVTIRTKVDRPPQSLEANGKSNTDTKRGKGAKAGVPKTSPPAPEWFIKANEAIGDKALAGVDSASTPISRVENLFKCLQAHPDHEKLHQALANACRDAAKQPTKVPRPRVAKPSLDDEE